MKVTNITEQLRIKHLLWILVEDYGLENIEVTKPLSNLKFAPFYGCYMVRPSEV